MKALIWQLITTELQRRHFRVIESFFFPSKITIHKQQTERRETGKHKKLNDAQRFFHYHEKCPKTARREKNFRIKFGN